MLGDEQLMKQTDVPQKLEVGQFIVDLDYNGLDMGQSYPVNQMYIDEYNPKHAFHPSGQPSIRLVDEMENYIGAVLVRFVEKDNFVVKVRIIGYPDRTEANLLIPAKELSKIGIKNLDIAQKRLPFMKGVILSEINRQFPTYWNID